MINSEERTLTNYLSGFISENKKNRIEEVLDLRTRHVTVVLEDIYKSHNASAVLRTCEGFGLQDIHIVEQRNTYDVNPYVTRGSAKWLTLHKYEHPSQLNIESCFKKLRQENYQIVATSPLAAMAVEDISMDQKVAIVFGTEEDGITDYVKEQADSLIKIPMYGFTESFNISVSVGIILSMLVERLKKTKVDWRLRNDEKVMLRHEWYKKSIKHVDALIENFRQNQA